MRIPVLPLLGALLLSAAPACAEGLLRIENCRIVDDRGPVKAMGVNYVDGFWNFARDGKREAYLPYLDALAEAKIPFIRMAFGPWASSDEKAPSLAQIADFVTGRERYFARFDEFLADLKARNIALVLDVFWNTDPYAVHFGEPLSATSTPGTRTFDFLNDTVAEIGRRYGRDPAIWMIEFENEGNLLIDFPRAPHTRKQLIARTTGLASALRAAGDGHLIDSGDSLPRPAAERLDEGQGWKPDSQAAFLHALDAETAADVASVHIYPEKPNERPWDGGDVLNLLPLLAAHSAQTCKPVFVGEFGAVDNDYEVYLRHMIVNTAPITAIWGYGRPIFDPYSNKIKEKIKYY